MKNAVLFEISVEEKFESVLAILNKEENNVKGLNLEKNDNNIKIYSVVNKKAGKFEMTKNRYQLGMNLVFQNKNEKNGVLDMSKANQIVRKELESFEGLDIRILFNTDVQNFGKTEQAIFKKNVMNFAKPQYVISKMSENEISFAKEKVNTETNWVMRKMLMNMNEEYVQFDYEANFDQENFKVEVKTDDFEETITLTIGFDGDIIVSIDGKETSYQLDLDMLATINPSKIIWDIDKTYHLSEGKNQGSYLNNVLVNSLNNIPEKRLDILTMLEPSKKAFLTNISKGYVSLNATEQVEKEMTNILNGISEKDVLANIEMCGFKELNAAQYEIKFVLSQTHFKISMDVLYNVKKCELI